MQLARGVREHLERRTSWRSSASPGSGFGVSKARASSQTRCHSLLDLLRVVLLVITRPVLRSGYKKASRWRGRGSCRGARRVRFLRYGRSCFTARMLALFPRRQPASPAVSSWSARDGDSVGGALGARRALRDAARRLLRADAARAGARCSGGPRPDALVVYGTKAFPNVALMRLLAEEGLGADVSTLGELASRSAPGSTASGSSCTATTSPTRSCARPPRPARSSSLDALDEAGARGRGRRAPRARPRHARRRGRDARGDPHRPPRLEVRPRRRTTRSRRIGPRARRARGRGAARPRRLAARRRARRSCWRSSWLATFAARCRAELDWTPAHVDLGGGLRDPRTSPRSRSRRSRQLVRDRRRRGRARVGGARPAARRG